MSNSFEPLFPSGQPTDAELAQALVRAAGDLALGMRERGLQGEQKTSVSDVVTAADRAAEAFIVEQLRRLRPEDGILGEEGAAHAGTSGRSWVIDPVDGTYNFLSGSTYWCSALALSQDAAGHDSASYGAAGQNAKDPQVLYGAVYQPQEGKLWCGGPGQPSTLNGVSLEPLEDLPLGLLSAGTYLHPTWLGVPDARDPWLAAAGQLATFRLLGSGSCDLSRVAQGELGCWFQHSTALWDWLPGKAIVRAAGGDTAIVTVHGLDWFLAGSPMAVRELSAALRSA
ncbi:inositol monophosphatase family protein [Psychromicrobium xiongbiense]|uniref:inositol monophosphatase family protein n=1 Tax=Psychromicrobium xiongbiense TaxID=3051184 RepID=UPI0025526BE5|nr:inositol monophosphatase family protein [Psychromicrobium sp. YIM S02556]